MSSNTSTGIGEKGSKLWIQKLVNLNKGQDLSNHIKRLDSSINEITWLSPLKEDNYNEIKDLRNIKKGNKSIITKEELSFWPKNGPWWDAIGICEDETIILVEAKAHINETHTKCSATSNSSKELINKTLKEVYENLSNDKLCDTDWLDSKFDVWHNRYYQIANRLSFLVKLKEQGKKVKLVFLNIAGDSGYIETSIEQWITHYKKISSDMGIDLFNLEDVIILDLDVSKL